MPQKCFEFLGEGERDVTPTLPRLEDFVIGIDYRLICPNYQFTIH